ncbi:hypothetical protein FGB62_137g15 [Gracilaria domingensis]|nr:hypothetical protein FGB62_137g15 [Gracilaria domingensis]
MARAVVLPEKAAGTGRALRIRRVAKIVGTWRTEEKLTLIGDDGTRRNIDLADELRYHIAAHIAGDLRKSGAIYGRA